MSRKQVLYLDGIEESIRMAITAYARLRASCYAQSQAMQDAQEDPNRRQAPDKWMQSTTLLDAWCLVDVLNRLRVLTSATPGLKKSSPGVAILLRALAPIEDLRNAVQHLDTHVPKALVGTPTPLWGYLSWVRPHPETGGFSIGALIPGTLEKGPGPVIQIPGGNFEMPVGHINLTAAGKIVSLSELTYAVHRFQSRFDRAITAAIADHPAPDNGDAKEELVVYVDASDT